MSDDDIIPLRHSYALSMVERISELEAENERLREIAEAADSYHDVACNPDWCRLCRAISAWKEARRG